MSDEPANSHFTAAADTQRALRQRFELFRRALDRCDHAASQSALLEFEVALHQRTAIERRLLLPALPASGATKRSPRAEVELQFDQLRDLTRHIRADLATGADGGAARGEFLGFVANLARRIEAHAGEMERIYYPAALPALSDNDRRALERGA